MVLLLKLDERRAWVWAKPTVAVASRRILHVPHLAVKGLCQIETGTFKNGRKGPTPTC